jgi:hypothetical protein
MLVALLIILIALWVLGLLPQGGFVVPNPTLFSLNSHDVTLFNLITLIIISWVVGILPSPFRQVAFVLLVLWVISLLGILAIPGLANWLVLAVIIGLIFYLIRGVSGQL